MREIKFRVWDKKRNQWLPADKLGIDNLGNAFIFGDSTGEEDEEGNEILKAALVEDADSYVIMQFTGLKDKNGKEIYEGDIIRMENELWQVGWYALQAGFTLLSLSLKTTNTGIASAGVPIRNFQWLHSKNEIGNFVLGYDRKTQKTMPLEVIGNIYENPELLK